MSRTLLQDPGLWKEAALIGGQWRTATPHGHSPLINPADGAVLAQLPRCQEAETTEAINAAQAAWGPWRRTPARQRAALLQRWHELITAHREDLATLITLEEGKPLAEARAEVDYANGFVRWFAEEAQRVRGDLIPAGQDSQRLLALRRPVGVCAAITPWNFPAAMVTRKAAPALAAGCTVVVKPASQTPLTALALGELAHRAGLPAGVYNVLTGADTGRIGGVLTRHPAVRKLTFTGSTEVGRLLLRQSADTVKKCSMELGGNAALIVLDDADPDRAVEGILHAKFRNTGQSCIAANRVLVQAPLHDTLARRLAERCRALRVGPGLEPGVQIGPLIDDAAVQRLEALLAEAVAGGATVLAGGRRHALGGRFFEPTVVAGVRPDMQLAREEVFGPVLPLLRFEQDDEAIALANDTEFGLAAYLFSRDAARIWRTAEALETGMVGVNTGLISNEVAPFGGVKQSGLGREGSHLGMAEYLETQYVCWDGLAPAA
ncbi:NAD-dependent succinate-semialdehyde dehydrogenase [Ideonella livida]|uniref:NAD-dependent succinate-semialdehyde dehydrogenase n=1 Tax=Ideonella livida TaxID=2707176 RepID=A0A7C9PK33_9BURK|nr:NAD-dependent succinate-semialdehyde dehydrogenase [Ideonella livida]NDY93893.1 NAD-dependent succinate-semialdehyde dehydrogenase [Ideonella livida]